MGGKIITETIFIMFHFPIAELIFFTKTVKDGSYVDLL